MLAQLLASTDLVHLLLHLLWPHIRVRFAWTAPWVNASSGTTSILFLENTARESICQRLQSGFLNGLQCPTFERLAVPSLSWLAPHVPVVGQAGRLWNVSLEEQGTLIPMEDIAERLGGGCGDDPLSPKSRSWGGPRCGGLHRVAPRGGVVLHRRWK